MARIISTEQKDIPDYSSIRDIKIQQNIPGNRDIVEISSQGVQRRTDSESTRPGGIYVDVPRYIRGVQNVAIMMQEIAMLKMMLPDEINIIANPPDYTFVLLENYLLGQGYQPSPSNILIKIPPEYPQIPPGLNPTYGIYVVGGLKRNGQALQCVKDQYHWDCVHNPSEMKQKGWAWWCFARLESWDPYRDNLFKAIVILTETLRNPEQQRFG